MFPHKFYEVIEVDGVYFCTGKLIQKYTIRCTGEWDDKKYTENLCDKMNNEKMTELASKGILF